ncbi:MAG: hypothetical protein ACKOQ8_05925 [Micrococcales bacterium]
MTYVIISNNRINSFGGVVTTYETREQAEQARRSPEVEQVMPLGEAVLAERASHSIALSNERDSHVRLQLALRDFLENGVRDSWDEAERARFIEEHQTLAEEIGFEFTERTVVTITVEVKVTKPIGVELDSTDFEVSIDGASDEIDVTSYEIEDVTE